jgi:hypothetical protein
MYGTTNIKFAVTLFRVLRSVDKFPYVIIFKLTFYLGVFSKRTCTLVCALVKCFMTTMIADSMDCVNMKCADFWLCCMLSYLKTFRSRNTHTTVY